MDKGKVITLLTKQLREIEEALADLKSNEHRVYTQREATLELTKATILGSLGNLSDSK